MRTTLPFAFLFAFTFACSSGSTTSSQDAGTPDTAATDQLVADSLGLEVQDLVQADVRAPDTISVPDVTDRAPETVDVTEPEWVEPLCQDDEPCTVENDFGTCAGFRICTAEGLAECDAPTPAAETCNGVDDDCDGDVDEPDNVEGDYVSLCDDGNPCTDDQCGGESGCLNVALTGNECKDGDACTEGDHCDAGECVGNPVVCEDGDPCTDDLCDPLGGCTFDWNAAPCDDGDPCTVKDTCTDGVCSGYDVACECQTDADCEPIEDGDLCNGTLTCDTSALPYSCQVAPETIVVCPLPAPGPDAICLQALCNPEDGTCSLVPDHEAYACEDGDACTIGDLCVAGTCTAGLPVNCADDNPCTDDACDPDEGCVSTPNNEPCDDGNICTVGDTCTEGQCQPGPEPLTCDDGNPCTADGCDPAFGCQHVATSGECDDGDPCTLGDHCQDTLCVPDSLVLCDDGNPCTTDQCGLDGGCTYVVNTAPCDDGDLCTLGDHCHLGECIHSGTLSCDDGNLCTDDACDPETGCQHSNNTAVCDDGNVCTVNDVCIAGWCAGIVVDCDDGSACTKDSCDPVDGCQFEPFDGPCEDGNPCTNGDACTNGLCIPGSQPANCDDGNTCTDDWCEPWVGCLHSNNSAPCEDGNPCTLGDYCQNGTCLPGPGGLSCNDNNPCTDDFCDLDIGCQYEPNSEPCDDGNPCTLGDQCGFGSCQPGPDTLDCDDDNDCTSDSCQSAFGCMYTHVADGTPCGEEEGWTCNSGLCVSANQETRLVFVTSIGHNGDLGGIAGADAFCMQRAADVGLQGTFLAWLSTDEYSTCPKARFVKSDIPYALIDGTIIAADWADLTDGEIAAPINKTEKNTTPTTGPSVWSYTRIDGTPGLFDNPNHTCYGTNCHCNGWTTTQTQGYNKPGSAVGQWAKTNDDWTDYSFANACASLRAIYCFEQ